MDMNGMRNATPQQRICVVCTSPFASGLFLVGNQAHMRPLLDRYGICPECEDLYKSGYIAVISIDMAKSPVVNGQLTLGQERRTGDVAHLKKEHFERLFPKTEAEREGRMRLYLMVDKKVMKMLKQALPQKERHEVRAANDGGDSDATS